MEPAWIWALGLASTGYLVWAFCGLVARARRHVAADALDRRTGRALRFALDRRRADRRRSRRSR